MHLENEKYVLPEEVLLRIFSEADSKELRKLLGINNHWRLLLIQNPVIMRKLPLILQGNDWKNKLEFVELYGKYIREIIFTNSEIDSIDEIREILNLTPKLEKLSFENIKLKKIEPEIGNVVRMDYYQHPRDNEVEIIEMIPVIIEKIHLSVLKHLSIKVQNETTILSDFRKNFNVHLNSFSFELKSEDQLNDFEEFLVEQHTLKSLEIISGTELIFTSSDELLEKIKFKLTKLIITAGLLRHDTNFMNFLISQKDKLTDFLMNIEHVDFRYHNFIFTHLNSLEVLLFDIDTLATTESLKNLKKFKQNKSLKMLRLAGKNHHLNIFDAVINIFPNLQQLHIDNLKAFYGDQIKTLCYLEYLKIDQLNRKCLEFNKIPRLKKLELNRVTESFFHEMYEMNLMNNFTQFSFGAKDIHHNYIHQNQDFESIAVS